MSKVNRVGHWHWHGDILNISLIFSHISRFKWLAFCFDVWIRSTRAMAVSDQHKLWQLKFCIALTHGITPCNHKHLQLCTNLHCVPFPMDSNLHVLFQGRQCEEPLWLHMKVRSILYYAEEAFNSNMVSQVDCIAMKIWNVSFVIMSYQQLHISCNIWNILDMCTCSGSMNCNPLLLMSLNFFNKFSLFFIGEGLIFF